MIDVMTEVTTRPTKPKDLNQVLNLVQHLAEYEKSPDEVSTTLEDYKRNFEEGVFDVILAEVDGEIAGMALYFLAWSTRKGRMLYLDDFIVKKEHRGLGIGQILFDAFLDKARELDCTLAKWQVIDWNEPALNFYMKNNAVIEKDWWNGKVFLKNL